MPKTFIITEDGTPDVSVSFSFDGTALELVEAARAAKNSLGVILTEILSVICQSNDASQFNFLEGLTFAVDAFSDDDFELLSHEQQLYCNDLIKRRRDSSLFAWPNDCKWAIIKRVPRPKMATTPRRSDKPKPEAKPKPKPKRKKSHKMKGKLKPNGNDLPVSVLVLRACRGRPLNSSDLCELFDTSSRSTILSAIYRMDKSGYISKSGDDDEQALLTTTEQGMEALKEFDATFPHLAEKKPGDNEPQPPVTE